MKKIFFLIFITSFITMSLMAQTATRASSLPSTPESERLALNPNTGFPSKPLPTSDTHNTRNLLVESFESTTFPPAGWVNHNQTGDSNGFWKAGSYSEINMGTPGTIPDGNRQAYSRSWLSGDIGFQADYWLISPAIELPAAATVKFISTSEAGYEDTIEVLVSTGGISTGVPAGTLAPVGNPGTVIGDFTSLFRQLVPGSTGSNGTPPDWYNPSEYSVSLAAYTGQTVRIAFRHKHFDGSFLALDHIRVEASLDHDLAALSITGPASTMVNSPVSFDIVVKNQGANPAPSYTVNLMRVGVTTPLATTTGTNLVAGNEATFTLGWTPTAAANGIQLYGEVLYAADLSTTNNKTANKNFNVFPEGMVEVSVGNWDSPASVSTLPFYYYWETCLSQTIYSGSDIGVPGLVNQITYRHLSGNTAVDNNIVRIYMANTSVDVFANTSSWIPQSEFELVYEGNIGTLSSAPQDIVIVLDTPFVYTGGNLVVQNYRVFNGNYTSKSWAGTQTVPGNSLYSYTLSNVNLMETFTNSTLLDGIANVKFQILTGDSGTITGTVSSTSGPVAGALVALDGTNRTTLTNASGQYTFPFVGVGPVTLTASKFGFYNGTGSATVVADQTSTANITMTALPQVTVSGNVIASDTGAAIAGATVELVGYDNYSTTTNATGNFTINNVYASNTYELTITAPGYQKYFYDLIEVGTGNLTIPTITLEEKASPATQVRAELEGTNMRVTWSDPAADVEVDWFAAYDYDEVLGGFNSNAPVDFYHGVHRFTPDMLSALGIAGGGLAKVAFAIGEGINLSAYSTIEIKVYTGGYADSYNYDIDPGTLIYTQEVDMETINTDPLSWTEVLLDQIIEIPTNIEMWFGVQYNQISLPGAPYYAMGFGTPAVIDYTDLTEGFSWPWFGMYWDGGYDIGWALKGGAVSRAGAPVEFSVYDVLTPNAEPRAPRNNPNLASNLPAPSFTTVGRSAENQTSISRDMPLSQGTATLVRHDGNSSTTRDTRAHEGYNVHRINLLTDDITDPNTWTQIASGLPTSTLTYLDNAWNGLTGGEYRYAVVATYTNGVLAKAALSNIVYKDMTVDVTVNITTYDGLPATGAFVRLANVNGNSNHVYTATATGNSVAFGPIVWRGFYDVTVSKPGYETFIALNVDFTENSNTLGAFLGQSFEMINESFDSATFPPTGWTILDSDGDGQNWKREVVDFPEYATVASSYSYDDPTGTSYYPNNWLITFPMDFPADTNGATLTYRVTTTAAATWAFEHYGIFYSNTTNNQVDFVQIFDETLSYIEGSPFRDRTITLPFEEFAGQTVYLAFRHYESDDLYVVMIDDVKLTYTVEGSSENDIIGTPKVTALKSNYPNPFNPSTTISFDVAREGNVAVEIFNVKGQKVKTLVNDYRTAGNYKEEWNGTDENGKSVSSGIYFYKMTSGDFSATKKMIMMK